MGAVRTGHAGRIQGDQGCVVCRGFGSSAAVRSGLVEEGRLQGMQGTWESGGQGVWGRCQVISVRRGGNQLMVYVDSIRVCHVV